MTPNQWRAQGLRVERSRRPRSRGTAYRIFRQSDDACLGLAWSRAELDALLEGRAFAAESSPGARAAICRPSRRYL
jgi:hypothetical protein